MIHILKHTHPHLQSPPSLRARVGSVLALSLIACGLIVTTISGALAQEEDAPKGIEVPVSAQQVKRVLIALPPAINQGASADTVGISERLSSGVERALTLSGYFDFLERELYPQDPSAEGMNPNFTSWFNAGTQGLVKIAFDLQAGDDVKVTLKLFDIDQKKPISLAGGVDQTVTLKRDPAVLQAHIARFVNQVVKYYTGTEGFFGTRIAAIRKVGRNKELVMVNPDGSRVGTLAKSGGINLLPSLAKGKIYFTSYRDGGPNLYLYERGKVSRISGRKGINMGGVLSPSGGFLAASLSFQGSSEIYLLNPKSGDVLRRLTRNGRIDISPTWSPDGKKIAFVSDREGSPQIWVMNSDGSNQKRLTYQGKYNQSPRWSPNGDLIVFSSRDEKYVFDIFTIDPNDPSKITRLTQNQGNNVEPSWSPDGRHIVFSSTRTGRSELYIMTSDGFTQRRLTNGGGFTSPSWGE